MHQDEEQLKFTPLLFLLKAFINKLMSLVAAINYVTQIAEVVGLPWFTQGHKGESIKVLCGGGRGSKYYHIILGNLGTAPNCA